MSDPEIDIVRWALGDSARVQPILNKLTSLEALSGLSKDDLRYIIEALNRLYNNPSLSSTEQISLCHKWPLLIDWIEPVAGEGVLH